MIKVYECLKNKWNLKQLTSSHNAEIQNFLDLFKDFFLLCENQLGSSKGLLAACPLSKNLLEDKFVWGLYHQADLTGLVDIIQDYPEVGTLTIGYFLIHPAYRRQKIGSTFIKDMAQCLRETGFLKMKCVVQKQNPQALAFWLKNGFCPIEIDDKLDPKVKAKFILEKAL